RAHLKPIRAWSQAGKVHRPGAGRSTPPLRSTAFQTILILKMLARVELQGGEAEFDLILAWTKCEAAEIRLSRSGQGLIGAPYFHGCNQHRRRRPAFESRLRS